ncbi:hypothetical protein FRB94_002362 [Tulasnella sp. JGI-2019a]|nr:hypothetical protein FRB94_002362 [Tulasnella sp. JGI-2019a]KAG9031642.1 hypothetical protein FRB95_002451 [Tulasnella sp. JGI-2019a]
MAETRGRNIELRYGDRTSSISRTLSYAEARSATRERFGISGDLDISFHRSWSNWSGGYDRIASDSWDGVARVSSAVRVEVRTRERNDTPAVFDTPDLGTSDASLQHSDDESFPWGRVPLIQAPPAEPQSSLSAREASIPLERSDLGPGRPARPGDMVFVVPQAVQPVQTPPPPPYSRHPTEESARKVTFLISTPMGDMVTLSARRSVRVSKALEAACNTFKLRPAKCRLQHAGWVYGSSEMERLTLQSLDIEDGDQLGISWDDVIIRSELYLYNVAQKQEGIPSEEPSGRTSPNSSHVARVVVKLTPHWSFDAILPPVPINALAAGNSSISWQTRIQPDEKLAVANAPNPISCLSWESQAKPLVHNSGNSAHSSSTSVTPVAVEPTSPQHQGHAEVPSPPASNAAISTVPVSGLPTDDGLGKALVRFLWTTAFFGIVSVFGYLIAFLSFRSSSSRRNRRPRRSVDPSLLEDQGPFEPMESAAFLRDGNSVLLKTSDAEAYLREAYRDMGIPDEIASQWLSQRLTSITRHKFIALRFLSRAGYAKASTIRITPEPESVTRALLVFCGVQSDEVGNMWPKAQRRGSEPYDGSWGAVVVDRSNGIEKREGEGGMNAVELSWVEVFQDDE